MNATARFRPTGIPLADRLLEGNAADTLRGAAARGALPVTRAVLLTVLVSLRDDPDPAIAESARQTLSSFSAEELTAMLGNANCDPAVLAVFALDPALKGRPLSALMVNPALEDQTLLRVAQAGSAAAIDILLLNQERLVRSPAIVEALVANAGLTGDQRRRLLDFIEHTGSPAPAPEAAPAGTLEPELLGPVSEDELRSMLGQLSDLPFIDLEVGEFLESDSLIEAYADLDALGENFESVYTQILRMNPAQRLRAAMRGGREARLILIRDTNRIVSSAVLRNPRLTEEEVVTFAAQKSLSDDVLRQIGSSRAWTGTYVVVLNLVRNPKTPQAISMNSLGRLTSRDLQQIEKDRNIPEVIRRTAKKHIETRVAKPKTRKH